MQIRALRNVGFVKIFLPKKGGAGEFTRRFMLLKVR